MKIRQMQRGGGAELPRAGKKRSLHSSAGGVKLPVKRENSYDAPTQDYSQTFGWKHFDVSVGRFSPFRVGLKTPISVNLKSPMHHVCY